jgi:hypothetical protein
MYAFVAITLSFAPLNGFMWYRYEVYLSYNALFGVLICCGIGFVFYGNTPTPLIPPPSSCVFGQFISIFGMVHCEEE